ncbi:MAG: hypothetical protein EOO41_04480 [Methanobacteriota archaeon]|nr:MAG: hypothetical protein EOO41_04480 [Euryarchaeota archaeon]
MGDTIASPNKLDSGTSPSSSPRDDVAAPVDVAAAAAVAAAVAAGDEQRGCARARVPQRWA